MTEDFDALIAKRKAKSIERYNKGALSQMMKKLGFKPKEVDKAENILGSEFNFLWFQDKFPNFEWVVRACHTSSDISLYDMIKRLSKTQVWEAYKDLENEGWIRPEAVIFNISRLGKWVLCNDLDIKGNFKKAIVHKGAFEIQIMPLQGFCNNTNFSAPVGWSDDLDE